MKHLMIISSVLFLINRAQAGRYITAIEKCENEDDYPGKVDADYDADNRIASISLHLPFDIDDEQICNVMLYKKDETGNWQSFGETTSNLIDMKNTYLEPAYKKIQKASTPSIDSDSFVSANDYKIDNLELDEEDCTVSNLPSGELKIQGEIIDNDGNPGVCMVVHLHVD